MHALAHSTATLILCRDYASASVRAPELVVLAEEKGSLYWKANAMMWQGCVSALTGQPSDAIEMLTPSARRIPVDRSNNLHALRVVAPGARPRGNREIQ